MLSLLETVQGILAEGKADGPQIERLRRQLYADGTIDRLKANVLVGLYRRVQFQSSEFQRLYYQVIKDHLLALERLGAEEAEWLRQVLLSEGAFTDEERKLLHELNGTKECGPEFVALFGQSTMRA